MTDRKDIPVQFTNIALSTTESTLAEGINKLVSGEYLISSYVENNGEEKVEIVGFDDTGSEVVVGKILSESKDYINREWTNMDGAILTEDTLTLVNTK